MAGGVQLAERAADFRWETDKLEAGIALAMSGGGFRAMLFHAGALLRINELGILSKIKRFSSVSGGSIAAGVLAATWDSLGRPAPSGEFNNFKESYVEPILEFSRQNLDVKNVLKGMLPWTSGANETVKSYKQHLFGEKTLQDIPRAPRFVFCATNLQTGVLFRFTDTYAGDYVLGKIERPSFLLAEAVAASSAFPPVLSPLKLKPPKGLFKDWDQMAAAELPVEVVTKLRRKIILSDGGVYDNHGLEPIVKRYMTLLVSDGGAPFASNASLGFDWVRQLKRILDVTDNQVRGLRRRDLIDRFRLGQAAFDAGTLADGDSHNVGRLGAYWGIDTDTAKVAPPHALDCDVRLANELARTSTRLADLGEKRSRQLINWGYAISDRCIRTHCRGLEFHDAKPPTWPYPEAAL